MGRGGKSAAFCHEFLGRVIGDEKEFFIHEKLSSKLANKSDCFFWFQKLNILKKLTKRPRGNLNNC